ncbi:hypothetical protein F5B20DRAFT_322902 [Whalleya microplaca]|nr:hypothetical protein F5B20DRAFT_322902 [Whalleya microplaca]
MPALARTGLQIHIAYVLRCCCATSGVIVTQILDNHAKAENIDPTRGYQGYQDEVPSCSSPIPTIVQDSPRELQIIQVTLHAHYVKPCTWHAHGVSLRIIFSKFR